MRRRRQTRVNYQQRLSSQKCFFVILTVSGILFGLLVLASIVIPLSITVGQKQITLTQTTTTIAPTFTNFTTTTTTTTSPPTTAPPTTIPIPPINITCPSSINVTIGDTIPFENAMAEGGCSSPLNITFEDNYIGNTQYPNPNIQVLEATNIENLGGVSPPSPVLGVGPNHVVAATYYGMPNGTLITVYNKGLDFVTSFLLNNIDQADSDCNLYGNGDPQVLYDHDAGKWLLLQKTGNISQALCLYASLDDDPTSGSWNLYKIPTFPIDPDFPKLALANTELYTVSLQNSAGPVVYFVERSPIIAGNPTTRTFFQTIPPLNGWIFQSIAPLDINNGPINVINGAIFIRQVDDEIHSVSPDPTTDFLEIFHFKDVDFDTNTTNLSNYFLNMTEFDSDLCGVNSTACIPQPDGAPLLDPLKEFIMPKLIYNHKNASVFGSFVTDVNGADLAGVYWFELKFLVGETLSLYQTNILSPTPTIYRWVSSPAMDYPDGSMVMMYSASSTALYPSLRATSRITTDPLNGIRGESDVVIGATPSYGLNNRWGDYFSINADPTTTKSFYGIGEYSPSGSSNWRVHIFKVIILQDTVQRTFTAFDQCMNQAQCVQEINLV